MWNPWRPPLRSTFGCKTIVQAAGAMGSTSESPLLELTSVDGGLVAAGQPLRIKGITWWGAESVAACPEGLDHQSIDDLLAFVSRQGFNAVRLPFLHQHVLFDEPLKTTAFSKKLNAALAPDGQPVSYTEMLLAVAQRAAAHGHRRAIRRGRRLSGDRVRGR